MSDRMLTLPGFDALSAPSPYPGSRLAFVGDLFRYPPAVAMGIGRELERLALAGIPAFADGRRVWTPNGSFFIELSGAPSRRLMSAVDYDKRARHAALRMTTDSIYSFNRPYAERFLKEDNTHA